MKLATCDILNNLKRTAEALEWIGKDIEILLIGAAAGMLTGQLPSHRVTQDCDVMNFKPMEAQNVVLEAAVRIAHQYQLPQDWLSTQAMCLNVLPDGWQARRVLVARFEKLTVYAASRIDLMAMKFYANRPQDRQDILEMKPSLEELGYIRKYLNMLRLPSRQADLDQVASALELVDAMEDLLYGS
jgi:hypothetical protein